MKIARKVSVALLSFTLLGVIVFSICYVPDHRSDLYSAMPAEVDFVSVHYRFAERAETLLGNNIFQSLVESMGVEQEQIDFMLHAPEGRRWLDRVASDLVVIGHVPPGVYSNEPAWGLAAWMGSSSIALRWQLDITAPKETRIGAIAGTKVWRFDLPDLPEGQRLFCAIKEGFALLAISDSSAMIQSMILASQGRGVSALDLQSAWMLPAVAELEINPDMFWVFDHGGWTGGLRMELSRIAADGMRGNLGFMRATFAEATVRETSRPISAPWREPMAYAILDKASVAAIAEVFDGHPATDIVEYLREKLSAEVGFVGLFGDRYQGRLAGFRVPGVLIAIPAADEDQSIDAVVAAIDRINAGYSAGIIYSRIPFRGHGVFFIQGSRDNLYGRLPPGEQLVFTHKDGLLFIASNRILIEHVVAGDLPSVATRQILLGSPGHTGAHAWLDLRRSAQAARLILSVFRLRLLAENPVDYHEARARLESIGNWFETFADYGEALLWSPAGAVTENMEFEVGAERP